MRPFALFNVNRAAWWHECISIWWHAYTEVEAGLIVKGQARPLLHPRICGSTQICKVLGICMELWSLACRCDSHRVQTFPDEHWSKKFFEGRRLLLCKSWVRSQDVLLQGKQKMKSLCWATVVQHILCQVEFLFIIDSVTTVLIGIPFYLSCMKVWGTYTVASLCPFAPAYIDNSVVTDDWTALSLTKHCTVCIHASISR